MAKKNKTAASAPQSEVRHSAVGAGFPGARLRPLTSLSLTTWALLLLLAVFTLVCNFHTPWAGDDLVYGPGYSKYYGGSILYYPRWVLRHWWLVNGRAANFLACLVMYFLPRWLVLCLNAGAVTAFYALIVKSCRMTVRSEAAQLSVLAIVLFTYCWWDSSWLIDVSLNYVWATVFGLGWLALFLNPASIHSRTALVCAAALALVAGCMHEAMSVALLLGVVVWMIITKGWKHLGREQRWLLWMFAIGTAVVFLSPGIWRRFGSERIPDDPMWLLVLKSDWMVLIMLLCIAIASVTRQGRERLHQLAFSPWVTWPVAAVASLCFSAVGGIVGRSGWFATTFALIAIVQWLQPLVTIPRKFSTIAIAALTGAIVAHMIEITRWQIRTGDEMEHILNQYVAAPDAPVYADYTTVEEVPPHVLNKLRLVPDPDNFYELWSIREILGDSIHPLIILPEAARGIKASQVGDSLPLGRWGYLSRRCPALADDSLGINILPDGRQRIVQQFRLPGDTTAIFYITPRHWNPGDR